MSVTNQQVVTLLENVLFETASQAAANAGAWINNSAAGSVSTLAAAMADSGEAKIAATVVGYYLASLGRAPNAAEVQYYVGIAEQGLTQGQIAAGQVASTTWDTIGKYFAHSPEFATRGNIDFSLGNTAAYLEAVPWLYQSVLGRAASSAELAYYDNQVINGTDLGTLFREFTASPEFHTDTDAQIAAALASFGTSTVAGTQPPAVAVSVTLGAPPPPPPTSTPSPAPTPTPSFGALTTGVDTIDDHSLTGAHTYTAILGAGATLNASDSLTSNGLATLAITDSDTGGAVANFAAATLSGIAHMSLTLSGAAEDAGTSGLSLNLQTITGLTDFTLTATGTSGDYLRANTSIDLTATTASTIFSVVSGAHSLDLTDDALTDLSISGTLTNGVTLHDPSGGGTLVLHLNAAALSFTDADNMVTNLTVDSASASTVSAITDTALTQFHTGAGTQNVTFGTSATPLALGASVAVIDLSTDVSTTAGNFLQINSDSVNITLGTNNNSIDLNGHTGATIDVGVDAGYSGVTPVANLVLSNAAGNGNTLAFGSNVTLVHDGGVPADLATLIADLYGASPPAGGAYWATIGGDTYIVESAAGAGAPSSTDTTIIKIVGGASPTATGSDHFIHI